MRLSAYASETNKYKTTWKVLCILYICWALADHGKLPKMVSHEHGIICLYVQYLISFGAK